MASTLRLELPRDTRLQVTPEQFIPLAAANPNLRLERNANGELIVMPPTGGESGQRNFSLIGQLAAWVASHPDLGEGFDSSTGFLLPNGAIRSPDVAWVRRHRWESLTPEQRRGFPPLCPDFVIELGSASDDLAPLQAKMQEYVSQGTELGWLINPQQRQVEWYSADSEMEVLNHPLELSGEPVLPGFRLQLSRIWG
ncbi:Uma2 family endonuclease [Geitlerinema sp. P-1104]|uniref:Uma2 family endonuclease n=1 Tax=Geitlerinema sp. P-1104 TaxID=2546230 RepID=UPI00147693EE|nr:Uma2 family endonuclease [Geitlerinema sp. P-1104]NMG60749.1 Uma2 family endonuclease [Geitlerinema sp. P-1104]